MAHVLANRVKETTLTEGTSVYALEGAVTGFQTFSSVLSDGDTTYYVCSDNADFEVGVGTYTSSTDTLSRTAVIESSNSNNAVSWAAGTREILICLPAQKLSTMPSYLTSNDLPTGQVKGEFAFLESGSIAVWNGSSWLTTAVS